MTRYRIHSPGRPEHGKIVETLGPICSLVRELVGVTEWDTYEVVPDRLTDGDCEQVCAVEDWVPRKEDCSD